MNEQYEIIDDNGTIHSGNEEEMLTAFKTMTGVYKNENLKEKYCTEWAGDLKMIKVIYIDR